MMDYIDENILKAKHQQEEAKKQATSEENINKENSQSIYDDLITIYGIPVVFEGRNIIQDYASIRMPNDFTERTPEEIASVYFHGSRPQYVFSNEYLPFMLALNWTSNMISNENIIVTWIKVDNATPISAFSDFGSVEGQRIDMYYTVDDSGHFRLDKEVRYKPQIYTQSYLEDNSKELWDGNEVPLE